MQSTTSLTGATPRPMADRSPAGWLRLLVRLPLLGSTTALLYLAWLATRPLALFSRELGRRTHFAIVRAWGRCSCAILGIRVERRGPAPAPPYFLVSNHLSYVDIVVLFCHLDGYFLAKSEVASWPVLGWLASTTGTLFVDRARKSDLKRVVQLVQDRLQGGHGVIVFPEGTSTRGDRVHPFKPSLFEVAVLTGLPVSTAAVTYATPEGAPPAELSVCWWGDMGFLSHARCLLSLPSVRATVSFGGAPLQGSDRKGLATAAQAAVQDLFEPVAPHAAQPQP